MRATGLVYALMLLSYLRLGACGQEEVALNRGGDAQNAPMTDCEGDRPQTLVARPFHAGQRSGLPLRLVSCQDQLVRQLIHSFSLALSSRPPLFCLPSTTAVYRRTGLYHHYTPRQAGDPNSANAPVLWPAWEGRRLAAQGNTAGAAAMAAMLASGRGGVGRGSFSDVFAEAWSSVGTAASAGGADGGSGAWEGGSFFLEIKAHPEVQEAQRDCMCEFWDRLKYRH